MNPWKDYYPIPRRDGWELVMEPLVKRITGAQQADVRAGCKFDNEVFFMQPHFLGDICFCSYGKARRDFEKHHQHSVQCFHTFWKDIDDTFKAHPKYHESNKLKAERVNMIRNLCVRNQIKYNPVNIHRLCTCTFETEWKKLGFKHDEDCITILPNFWFKAGDIKIWWYKFFFRDAYSNKKLDLDRFREIVAICINSLNKPTK